MKKLLFAISSALFIALFSWSVSASSFASHPQKLDGAIKKLLAFPKARGVLDLAQAQGSIKVKLSPFSVSTSNAMWRSDIRTVVLNSKRPRSEGDVIRSVLFELHNALNHHKFVVLDKQARANLVSKEAYVREIEKIEHQNALQTMQLLEEGIRRGYYPTSASWPIIRDFEEHYKVQQLSGHSQFIAKVYNTLNPKGKHMAYEGTVMAHTLSSAEKQHLMRSISQKDRLRYG